MKNLVGLILLSFCFSAFAGISLDIDYKNVEMGKSASLKKKLNVYLDEVKTIKLPKSNTEVEIKVTDRISEVLTDGQKLEDQVLVDMKVFEVTKNERKLIASPKIITILGKEATMETYEDEGRKKPLMTLKVIPSRN